VVGLATIVPLSDADVLITDEALPPNAREVLGSQVGELVIARTPVARAGER
jgi:DeoR/GlpR family transcriptional regulator of sugar metabolism